MFLLTISPLNGGRSTIKKAVNEISEKVWFLPHIQRSFVWKYDRNNNQIKRIKEKEISCRALGRMSAAKLLREKMEKWKEEIRNKVKYFEEVAIQSPEIGKLICGILYLCEGAKYPSTRGLIFGNSDPMVICCFLGLLRRFFAIKEDKLRCRVMYRWDQDSRRLERYWSNVTDIPLKQFFKTKPDARTKNKPTRKVNYRGVCAIQYSDTTLQFTLQAIGETIIKKWSRRGSNPLPLPCHGSALPGELRPLK